MFEQLISYSEPLPLRAALHALILALILTQALGAVYVWTFQGMSYTRSFVHAIVIGGVITAMLMLAIGNNIAAGIGLAGSLAIVRFRTSVRDPRDIVFIFAAMAAGIASGLRAYQIAIAGTVVFCGAIGLLTLMGYGQTRQFDGLLRFYALGDDDTDRALAAVMRRFTRRFSLISIREIRQGEAIEHAYQIRLRDQDERAAMVRALEAIAGVERVSVHFQEETLEL